MSEMLKVTMLVTFSLTLGDNRLDDGSNRMKKVWLLLAYLICSRGSRPSQDSLLTLLQGGSIPTHRCPSTTASSRWSRWNVPNFIIS